LKKIETIAIVGMRCAGKSTVGALLAQKLDATFVDTDRLVEDHLGVSIEDLFQQGREAEFRAAEEDICIQALKSGGVVSLGGGAIASERVRRALWCVMTVFMDASENLIVSRLEKDGRPSLTGQPASMEAAGVNRMRRPWYMDVSDFVIHVDGKTPEQLSNEILRAIKGFEKDDE